MALGSLLAIAVDLHKNGKLAEAERLYLEVLRKEPSNFIACHSLALIRLQVGDAAQAVYLFAAALKSDPCSMPALINYGLALQRERRFEEALASFDQALTIIPDHPDVLYNRGVVLWDLGRFEDALTTYDHLLALIPNIAAAWYNRGNALQSLGRFAEALGSYDRAIAIDPRFAEFYLNRGNTLVQLGHLDRARQSYEEALQRNPLSCSTLINLGNCLWRMKHLHEAVAAYDRALTIDPRHIGGHVGRGNALADLNRLGEALESYNEAIAINPDSVTARTDRANLLQRLQRFGEALKDLQNALSIEPNNIPALCGIANVALHLCDWEIMEKIDVTLDSEIKEGKPIIDPFTLIGYRDDPALQLRCAQNYISRRLAGAPQPMWQGQPSHRDKIRLVYLSSDFRNHATAMLISKLFECHDRSRFDVIGVSFGPNDGGALRARIVDACDEFYDVCFEADENVARLIHKLEADIVVDLKGHTVDSRPEIFNYRPAPIHVNYLGYPGTLGADFMDYIIADGIVAPFKNQRFFTERIVQLPHSYQVNDCNRPIASNRQTHQDVGLPEDGFVFCSFNQHWKIRPPMFEVWMRLLAAVPVSVLWLIEDIEESAQNLRRWASMHDIHPSRLIFAPRESNHDHLARHELADLFLDTLPCNAHTTASDALWAGLPVITCCGEGFASRVATSLLYAVGLRELVTQTIEEYEALALKLARDRKYLSSLRAKLAHQRAMKVLFDTDLFRSHIEAAYQEMSDIARRGEKPTAFRITRSGKIAPLDGGTLL